MIENNIINILSQPRCSVCHIRIATKRCDMPIGRISYVGHPPRSEMEYSHMAFHKNIKLEPKTITCDRFLCDHCAIEIHNGIDFCPACVQKIKTKHL